MKNHFELESNGESKCPFMGGVKKQSAGGGSNNNFWWPNKLKLNVLSVPL